MLVTIISDASVCPITGVGAWAGYVRSQRGLSYFDGVFKELIRDTRRAEFWAACNSLKAAQLKGLAIPDDRVIIQIDNMATHAMLIQEIGMGDLSEWLSQYSWDIRHIRGHSGVATSRTYVHHQCDRRALKLMRQARERFQQTAQAQE